MNANIAELAPFTIGRISAHTAWRARREPDALDREAATRALAREAEEFGADGVAEIEFSVEQCRSGVCESVMLSRVVASGNAVRLALGA